MQSTRKQEEMYPWPKKLTSLSWHYEGKQFVASCADGSLVTWNIKPVGRKPASVLFPHREKGADSSEPLAPIEKVGGGGGHSTARCIKNLLRSEL